ncbi:MAG TPA: acyltransferase [Edaphobacter sp.]|nr:acyltransferase [Edaphobacter sp.]
MTSSIKGKPAFRDTNASVLLDLLRGIAALLVLFGHWRNLLFVDYPQLPAHKSLFLVPYALSSAGHQAVVIFFVLSGYLISGSVFRLLERDQWSWKGYLTHRLVRLWVVLIPGLLLCALWDNIGLHFHLAPSLYNGTAGNHIVPDIHPLLKPHIFFGNLFFLQSISVPVFGSDGPLWSLANEFWYYLLFPLGLITLRKQFSATQRIASGVLFLAVAWFVRHGILQLFPVWLAGTVLALLPPPRIGNRGRIIAAIIYSPLAFVFAKAHQIPSVLSDYLFGIATFFFLWTVLSAREPAKQNALSTRISRSLAGSSYTLYIVHVPFIVLLAALISGGIRWLPDMPHMIKALAILAAALLYAHLVASITEFHTDKIRRYIEGKLGISQKPLSNPQRFPV